MFCQLVLNRDSFYLLPYSVLMGSVPYYILILSEVWSPAFGSSQTSKPSYNRGNKNNDGDSWTYNLGPILHTKKSNTFQMWWKFNFSLIPIHPMATNVWTWLKSIDDISSLMTLSWVSFNLLYKLHICWKQMTSSDDFHSRIQACLTHLLLMLHICISESGQHWFI